MGEKSSPTFETQIVVGAELIDELDHVNNAAYFGFVELIARAHATAIGLSQEAMKRLGGAFVVREHVATYYGEAKEGDCLKIQTWIEAFSGPRCARIVQILKGDQKIFESKTDWVWVDVVKRLPRRIPPQIAQGFATGSLG